MKTNGVCAIYVCVEEIISSLIFLSFEVITDMQRNLWISAKAHMSMGQLQQGRASKEHCHVLASGYQTSWEEVSTTFVS